MFRLLLAVGSLPFALAHATVVQATPASEVRPVAGDAYRARFHPNGPEVALAGGAAGTADALRLETLWIARGGHRVAAPEVQRLARDGAVVRYERGAVVETYEPRPDGLKQSFVFESLPAGLGDLVVGVRVDTALELAHAGTDEVRFRATSGRSLAIAGVLGIDADGARAKGELRFADGVAELALPASFVEGAALPLVLDPLIGDAMQIASYTTFTTTVDPIHDVAFLPGPDVYLSAWVREYTPFESYAVVDGRILDPEGVLQGPPFQISTNVSGQNSGIDTRVAGVPAAGSFFVATLDLFGLNQTTKVRSVSPTGVVGTAYSVISGFLLGDVAGEATMAHDDAYLAYVDASGPDAGLIVLRFDVPTNTPVGQRLTVAPRNGTEAELRLPATGGVPGRYLLVWRDGAASTNLRGAIFDRDLSVLVQPFTITNGPDDDSQPSVDGDGTNWVVAFRRSTGQGDVWCRGVSYDPLGGGVTLTPERLVAGDPDLEQRDPAVSWVGESYLIAYAHQWDGNDYDVHVVSVESLDCRSCEGAFRAYFPPSADRPVRIASERAAGGTGDGAMMTFATNSEAPGPPGFFEKTLRLRRFDAEDGSVLDLGGGCGPAGTASATCGVSGTTDFGLRLQDSAPNAPALLVIGVKQQGLACGPCVLVPKAYFTVFGTTDSAGSATHSMALPASPVLPGTKVLAQWIVGTPGPCPLARPSLSNAIEVTIE